MSAPKPTPPTGLVVGACDTRLWGLSGAERARRTLVKAGIVQFAEDAGAAAAAAARFCLMVRADWVVDPALVGLLKAETGQVLVVRQDGAPVVLGGHVAGSDAPWLARALAAPAWDDGLPGHLKVIEHDPANPSIYLPLLRKRLIPAVLPLREDTIDAAERATFGSAYKGVTDVVTKYVWPVPARWATRWCAERKITPNMVTMLSLALVFVAMWLFVTGWFAAGLAAAWVMTFLDTVDGKLARTTLTSTKFGNVFDHGIDMIHPPFWWWAWHAGCLAAGAATPAPTLILGVVVIGYVLLRLQEAAFILIFGMQIHVWRRGDSLFRLVVARRNPILIILTVATLCGQPGLGMAVTAAWTAISIVVHATQTVQALMARRRGAIVSWMADA